MRTLGQKFRRETWRLRAQMLSISLVVAAGVMTVVTMQGTYLSLRAATEAYYRDYRLADVWSGLKRAPKSLQRQIEEIPGVAAVETRVTFAATLDLPGLAVPGLGRFVSLPDQRQSALNNIYLTSGRFPSPGHSDEVVVSEKFAMASHSMPGGKVRALINGTMRDLQVVGTAISPEYTYAIPPGSLYPDDARYGILWMDERSLGPAYDMRGAFNDVALRVSPGANRALVLARLDQVLKPYGGLGAYVRRDQLSARLLADELASDRVTGTVIPAVFLAVAVFLLNLVLSRLIATQRTEIAVLKAFGYSNGEVARHYLMFAFAAVLPGVLVGTGLGIWAGQGMISVYRAFFELPMLEYRPNGWVIAVAVGVSLLSAAAGALGAVRRAVRLAPAEAMRPEPPSRFQAGWLERTGIGHLLSTSGRMILRNVERRPVRTGLSAVGVAFSVAMLVIGLFLFDGMDRMMVLQFQIGQREDLSLTFNQPVSSAVTYDLRNLAGVTRAEIVRSTPVRLTAGHRRHDLPLTGVATDTRLRRIVTERGGIQRLPPEGLVLSAMLAEELHVAPGDSVDVEVLEGRRQTARLPVAGEVEDFLGLSAYLNLDALYRLAGEAPVVSGAYLQVDPEARDSVNAELKRLPVVAGVTSPTQMLRSFQQQIAQSLYVAVGFLILFSSIISAAVIYNGARIALSERGRELASLRVLGFTRAEVAVLLLGEQGIVTLLAIPLGWGIGIALAGAVTAAMRSETYRIPLVVSGRTYATSALIVVIAAAVSGLLVRRRLNRLDLMAVLKTRE